MRVEGNPAGARTHLFTLRIWAVNEGTGAPKWRSRLQNIRSGEVFFCENLSDLLSHIEETLCEQDQDEVP